MYVINTIRVLAIYEHEMYTIKMNAKYAKPGSSYKPLQPAVAHQAFSLDPQKNPYYK